MDKTLETLEPFTIEDAKLIVDVLAARPPPQETMTISYRVTVITEEELLRLPLDAISSSLHGITDPIGQLKKWLYDRLKELASWFSDVVNDVFKTFYNTFIAPALEAIKSVAENIYNFITSIPGAFTDMISWIQSQLMNVWTMIQSYIVQPIINAFSRILDMVTSGIDTISSFFTSQLPSMISNIPNLISRTLSTIQDMLQNYVITPLQSLFARISGLFGKIVDTITSFITEQLPSMISQVPQAIQSALQTVYSFIQDHIISPLQALVSQIISTIRSGIDTIVGFFTRQLPSFITRIPQMIQSSIAGITSFIQEHVIAPLQSLFTRILGTIRGGIDVIVGFFTRQLPQFISSIPQRIMGALQTVYSFIQNNVIAPLQALFARLVDMARGGINVIVSFFTSQLPSLIGRVPQMIMGALQTVYNFIQVHIIQPAQQIFARVIGVVRAGIDAIVGFFTRQLPQFIMSIPKRIMDALKIVYGFIQDHIIKPAQHLFSYVVNFIRRGIDAIINFFTKQLPSFIMSIPKRIMDALKTIYDFIKEHIIVPTQKTVTKIIEVVKGGAEVVIKFTTVQLPKALTELPKKISESFGKIYNYLKTHLIDPLEQSISSFMEKMKGWIHSIIDTLKNLPNTISNLLKGVYTALEKHVVKPVLGVFEKIKSTLATIVEHIAKGLPAALKKITSMILNLPNMIVKGVSAAGQTVLGFFTKLGGWIQTGFSHVLDALKNVARNMANLGHAFTGFINALLRLPDMLRQVFGTMVDKIVEFFRDPMTVFKAPLDWLKKNIYDPIVNFFKTMGDVLKEAKDKILGFFRDPLGTLAKAFTDLAKRMSEAAQGLWQGLLSGLKWVADRLWDGIKWLGSALQSVFSTVYGFFVDVAKAAASTISSIATSLFQAVYGTVSSILSSIYGAASSILQSAFAKHSPSLIDVIASPFIWVFDQIKSMFKTRVAENLKDVVEEAKENPLAVVYSYANVAVVGIAAGVVAATIAKFVRSIIEAVKEVELGSGGELGVPITAARLIQRMRIKNMVGEAIERALDALSHYLPDVTRYLLIGHMIWWAEPTRVFTRYMLSEYVGSELPPLEHTLALVRRYLPTPQRRDAYKLFETQLRMGGIWKGFIQAIYGIPDKLIAKYSDILSTIEKLYNPDENALEIADRFTPYTRRTRAFPLNLSFTIPTPSELAHMMIRDIILDPRHFAAVMMMHGFTPDVAFMFYLLHYRYPSPEKLAEFFWRGIAGELWNPNAPVDTSIMEAFGLSPEAMKATPPAQLNFNYSILWDMITTYMKWHDYARFPWKPGWPTDNSIIIDLMADIPGKIDLRWMTRWGIFDFWSAYGIGTKTTIKDITKTLSGATADKMVQMYETMLKSGGIVFDLRQFSRVLQATGLHPYWVPWIAIAEAINALTEERTLLRTGFLNLYKEGLWSIDELHMLLSGFFTVTFKVSYYDVEEKKDWVETTVELPVAFLPAESKLLELRAVMDRALDIYREAYRYMMRAVAWYILKPSEAEERLKSIVDAINNSFFAGTIQALTGKQLSLALDTGYWRAWSAYASIIQDLEAVERTRFYARYLIWTTLWSIRYGYVTRQEAEEWVKRLVETMHEHPLIEKAINLAVDFMVERYEREVAARAIVNLLRSRRISLNDAIEMLKQAGFTESLARNYIEANVVWYTPSLSMYGTLLETVPEALNITVAAIKHFNLPKDEEPYWMLYILRRPIRDELTLLRTRIYNYLALGATPDEIVKLLTTYYFTFTVSEKGVGIKAANEAQRLLEFYNKNAMVFQAFGIAPQEWILYNLIAEFEKRIEAARRAERERIPTPSTMATLAEYIPLPDDLIKKTLEEYNVAKEWLPIWFRYIKVRPIANDARGVISAWIRARRYGVPIPEGIEKYVQSLLKLLGYTSEEIQCIEARVELERLVSEATRYRQLYEPTYSFLATLSEYVDLESLPGFKQFFEGWVARLRSLGVPEPMLQAVLAYIHVRPVKSDYRRVITAAIRAFRYGVIDEKSLRSVIEEAANYGFTSREVELLERVVDYEVMVESAREYLPTPMTLATLSEYLVLPESLVREVFERRRVPPEWAKVWLEYIRVRPIKSDYRRLISTAVRAYRYGVIDERTLRQIVEDAKNYGFTPVELQLLERVVDLDVAIESAREYLPAPSTLATLSEYMVLPENMVMEALERRRVPPEWIKIWLTYIRVRPVKADYRRLLSYAFRAYRYGAITRQQLEQFIRNAENYGFTPVEIQLLEQEVDLEDLIENARAWYPSLGTITTWLEYIDVPRNIIEEVIERRRVPREIADLWLKYAYTRRISREVNRVLSVYIRIYEYFHTEPRLDREIEELLRRGGWTADELTILHTELGLRKAYRIMAEMIPTIRGFVRDALYLGEWEKLLNDLLAARGIDAHKYQKQVEYYKKLIKSRKINRRIGWYINRLALAYSIGAISRDEVLQRLQRLKTYGLDDDEIALIMDGMEVYRRYREMLRMLR